MRYWEHFPHGADMGVRGVGPTREVAFEQGALALVGIVTSPDAVEARESVVVECEAPDEELLFVDWLNALIYEMATRRMLFGRFEVAIDQGRLRGTAWGEPMDLDRHQPTVEVKGATYTTLHVGQDDTGQWTAQCVVDV